MNITEQHAAIAQYPGGFPETTWRICTVALRSVGADGCHRLYSDLAPPHRTPKLVVGGVAMGGRVQHTSLAD